MSFVAIFGAGDLGGAIACRMAGRGRFREIRLIDPGDKVAAGKALDIQQTGPIDRIETILSGTADELAGVGAEAFVFADVFGQGEWQGAAAVALLKKLIAAGAKGPFVFAGPNQTAVMEAAALELHVAPDRLIGTAGAALVGAIRALVGLEVDGSGADVSLALVGRPPAFVVAWSGATAGGALVTDRVPAHRLLGISQSLKALWPPGPFAIASATSEIVEALAFGSRRTHQATTILDGEFGARHRAALLPLVLGHGRVLRRVAPSLSAQERTEMETAINR